MSTQGIFKGWLNKKAYGFIKIPDDSSDIFLHITHATNPLELSAGCQVEFEIDTSEKKRQAVNAKLIAPPHYPPLKDNGSSRVPYNNSHEQLQDSEQITDETLESEEIEELDTDAANNALLSEISRWKREAKSEDNTRYFWHVREVDQISQGEKCFVIGRKGSGKTAICEHFSALSSHDVFSEKLSFKNFPFNELYDHKNAKYTKPNQFITIWKYLIYSSICRLMLKDNSVDLEIREQLSKIYDDKAPLSRRIGRWVSKDFGFSLFGLSLKITRSEDTHEPTNWIKNVDYLEDLLLNHVSESKYYILFDELDEDYRDIVAEEQFEQYTALITSLFKAVQDIRSIFGGGGAKILPIVFLRDDIYDLVKDSDKNKWGDFRVDLNWDVEKIKRLIAFRISRAIDQDCKNILPFDAAWGRVFGARRIGVGSNRQKSKISTFEFICRSTLIRPRDFVLYLQNCAQHAIESNVQIGPTVVRYVDKAFSNYLRQELTDELFAILPDISNTFDTISQLRKWNFSIPEFEQAYQQRVEQGFIQERNVKFVLQILFLFSVIGNSPRGGRYVFRYQNREARLNYNERVVVHRGLFKALQIL
ncbi:cold shock domain-containing protein [Pseudomonas chengduensis]|uniref:Cold shock protein, CspA family n=1 Tax=Pseudomonas sihuiensis TaxID=1274359 RepID=A0A1H2MKG0_9PSED|nr:MULTISPECIES: cold shock domain-containing protein [Pseudomonas]MDH1622502.1 cold shock domain-containing protein [Pseudomonas chengduensis]MDH1868367.1 cold shock domain-containing protein [Pseudomonas chengduensis]SDU93747.1 Cold shock protein, CspA family [Pseudomonas sihuiensis]